MLVVGLAASLFSTTAAGQTSKLDARLRARRGAGSSGGYAPMGLVGGGSTGPRRGVLIRVAPGTPLSALQAAFPSAEFRSQAGDVVTARADDAALDALALDSRVQAVEHEVQAHPLMDVVRSSSSNLGNATGTIYGTAATDLNNATGAGIVVGVVDTGIDWSHKDFINDVPNTSRILYLWDQTISSHVGGPFPAGYAYGAEYTQAQITSKIQGGAVTINEKDTNGHGTHVTGIAAGDGTDFGGGIPTGTFKGMAPSADIIFVRTTFATTDIIDGVNYIVARAAAAGKRAVINLSLGSQSGPHDGTSTFETALGAVAASTPVVVAMGNDSGSGPHAGIDIGAGGSAGVVVHRNNTTTACDLEFWFPGTDAYTAQVDLAGIGGNLIATANSNNSTTLGGHTVQIFNGTNAGHPLGHKQIYVYVNRGAGITTTDVTVTLTRTLNGGSGHVDGFADPSGENMSFSSYNDNIMTFGEPASTPNVFAVGSYASKKFWTAIDGFTYSFGTQSTLGLLSHFSSKGPTRDGRQIPDVTGPGDVIASAMSADALPANTLIMADNKHRILRGTSMATPVVAGILAARMQWNPGVTVAALHSIIRGQARTDSATGAVPNYAWGYGKVASSPQPVNSPIGLSATTMGPSSITWNWSAVTGADSYSLYYATNPAVRAATVAGPPFVQTGLAANTTTGLVIKGSGAGVDGPGSGISTSTLAAPPTALPTAIAHVTSATVSWTPCPAAPATLSCWGYSLVASTSPDLSGTQFAAITLNRADTFLQIPGLQPLTTYYFQQATLNFFGAQTTTGPVKTTTLTDLVAPITPQFSGATATSIRFDWNPNGNAPNLFYLAEASTSPAFAGAIVSSTTRNFYAVVSGLSVNTSYYFRVQAVGGPYLVAGFPVSTLAQDPAVSTAPFTAVSQTGFTLAWSSGGNAANTLYQAEISASPTFSPLAASSSTRNQYAVFGGLTPNTLYYARALAISQGGVTSAYTVLGSTPTFVLNPTLPPQPFSNQAPDGFTFSFNGGGNPPGTVYQVRISTDPAFGAFSGTVNTSGGSASFSGLNSNRLYYAQVAALNISGAPTAFTAAVSTGTTVVAPGAPSSAVTARTVSTLSSAWTSSTLGPGTQYQYQAGLNPAFAGAVSSVTLNTFATVSPLLANTSYYLRVRALSLNPPNPDGPWTAIGSASTLANAPTAAGVPFPLVGVASVTVAWTPLPLAPPAAGCEGYLAELSVNPAFTPVLRSSVVAPGAATANFAGLAYATVYYTRVASLDQEGNLNYFTIGSTRTNSPALSSATMTGGAMTLSIPSAFAIAPTVTVDIEAGTFPPGTAVTMLSGVTQDLANPASSVARLTALGSSVGIDISAGGLQPLKPVRLTIAYDPLLIPLGADARTLLVARYDDASGQWTLVPSAVDTSGRRIVATLDHFSSYAPFFAAAGASISDGIVFPQPWEVGAPNGAYGAQALTFANFPDGTKVRVLSLTGEQLWEGVAGVNGVLTWNGRNAHGRNAASGTYYAIIEGGGSRKVRRVVLIR